jgi:protein TonB
VEAVPLYRENPSPAYPGLARRRGYEGVVLLDVLVSAEGRVGELRVACSSGYSLLDRAAVEAVDGWRFEPGRRGDRPVSMRVRVPVRFRLQ